MKTNLVAHSSLSKHWFVVSEFVEAVHNSKLIYSLNHLITIQNISQEDAMEALQKSLQVCYLIDVNSKHHFKQIFVFDATTKTLYVDWLMSKKGFNLIVTQLSSLNKNTAHWLWELTRL